MATKAKNDGVPAVFQVADGMTRRVVTGWNYGEHVASTEDGEVWRCTRCKRTITVQVIPIETEVK